MEPLRTIEPQMILDSIYNGIVTINEKGIIIYFNKTAERIFNIPAHAALNQHILHVLPNTGGKLLDCLQTGKPFYGEKLKGETVALIANINPVIWEGKVSGVVSVFQDISEIESISKELDFFKNMKNWLDTIIDSSYDGLWICDHDGKVVRINKAAERIDDLKPDEVIGRNVRELVSKGVFDKSVTLEVIKRRTSVTMIQQVKGEKKVLVTGNPIFNDMDEVMFVVVNVRDISELDHLRSQLQETQALAKGYISKLSELEMKGVDSSNTIFRSEEIQRVVEIAIRVAKVDSTVLLLGESGVGKGVIAKLIHKNSERSSGPFIQVDCGGIPETLIESELFGYEKGAFTGAKTDGKPGFLELADRGTLFLDEIGDLPLSSQSKLLRFMEEHEVIRVGGTEPRQINVRIIAATNKNIEEMVSSKLFRKDLYYRLNVVPIYVPPLRERRDEILPLILHYLEKFNRAYQKKKVFSPEVLEALCRYDFPGNIRELSNIIERLVVVTENDRIEEKDIQSIIGALIVQSRSNFPSFDNFSLKEALERCETLILERAMERYHSQHEVAKVLKVNQATISRKMKKYSSKRIDAILHNNML